MARSVNNILTKGLSGMVGKQIVFRSWNGKTFISVAPKKPKQQSPQQKANRSKFKRATAFAKNMMKDPVKKAEYQKIAKDLELPNAYTAAITEFMRKPEVEEVDTSSYTGRADEQIIISANKKGFEIEEVEVQIINKKGAKIEEGMAEKGTAFSWIYRTKTDAPEKESAHFIIIVRDRAGNFVERRATGSLPIVVN